MKNKERILLINRICDEFEESLKSGHKSNIENYLSSAKSNQDDSEFIDSLLAELIALQIAYSDDRAATADLLRSRYPNRSDEIQTAIDQPSLLGTLNPAADETRFDDSKATLAARPSIPSNAGTRFENLKHFASGGLGDVYSAWDNTIKRQVAIKMLKPELVSNAEAKSRFLNEGAITGSLEHPGIIPVYDSGVTDDGQPFYAMRLFDGRTLTEAIEKVHSDLTAHDSLEKQRGLIRRLADICDAVSYAHDHGVIHRDLKPANILLGEYGESVVIDWGLARASSDIADVAVASVDSSRRNEEQNGRKPSLEATSSERLRGPHRTSFGKVLGTPEYMSPEQASGDPAKVGRATDTFSLGAILYCILTGGSPAGEQALITRERIEEAKQSDYVSARERNPSVPVGLDAICARAMHASPEQRYDSPGSLAQDLNRWLSDQPIDARPDTMLDRTARFLRKHRRWTAAAVFTLIAITAGSIVATSVISSQSKRLSESNNRANESLKSSIAAITDFFQQVEKSRAFLDTPATIELRKQLLTDGTKYLQDFLETNRENPNLQLEVGKALTQLSALHERLGENEAVRERALEAIEILKKLHESSPRNHEVAAFLAAAYFNVGLKAARSEGFQAASPYFERAIDVSQDLPGAALNEDFAPDLAQVYFDSRIELANARFRHGERDRAIRDAVETLELAREFAESFGDIAVIQQRTSISHNLVGVMHATSVGAERAAQFYRQAIGFAQRAVELQATDRNKRQLAAARGNLVIALQDLDEYDREEVRKLQKQVIAHYESAMERNPGNGRRRLDYIKAIANSGSVFGQMTPEEGLPYLEQAETLLDAASEKHKWENDREAWISLARIKSPFLITFAGNCALRGQFEEHLNLLEQYVEHEKLMWERLPGSTKNRKRRICNILYQAVPALSSDGRLKEACNVFRLYLETETNAIIDEPTSNILCDRMIAMAKPEHDPNLVGAAWRIIFARPLRSRSWNWNADRPSTSNRACHNCR